MFYERFKLASGAFFGQSLSVKLNRLSNIFPLYLHEGD